MGSEMCIRDMINTVTGEVVERALTDAEIADFDALAVEFADYNKNYRIGKSTPWRRMTDEEAINVREQIQKQPVRMQMIYDAAAYLDTGDELFVQISNLLTALFGKQRSDELLAPETSDGN